MTKLKVFVGIPPLLGGPITEWYEYRQQEGRKNMAARIDSTICRKRPKKRQGAKR